LLAGTFARCRREASSINLQIAFDHCHPSVWARDESLMSVIERYFASAVSAAKKRDFGQLANFNADVDN
jgi:hypothetical protein